MPIPGATGLIMGWINPYATGTGSNGVNLFSSLRPNPTGTGYITDVQGLKMAMGVRGGASFSLAAEFNNIPIAGSARLVAQYRVRTGFTAPSGGFPWVLQWDFTTTLWKTQMCIGQSAGTILIAGGVDAYDAVGNDLTTGNPGECDTTHLGAFAGGTVDPAYRLFNTTDPSHPTVLDLNLGSDYWRYQGGGTPINGTYGPVGPENDSKQQSLSPPGTSPGSTFGPGGLNPWWWCESITPAEWSQWIIAPDWQSQLTYDMSNPAIFGLHFDSTSTPKWAPKNWGTDGSAVYGSIPAYYFNGSSASFYTNHGSSGVSLTHSSFRADDGSPLHGTTGTPATADQAAVTIPASGAYHATGIWTGTNSGGYLVLPGGPATTVAGKIQARRKR